MNALQCIDSKGAVIELCLESLCLGFRERGNYRFTGAQLGSQLFVDDEPLSVDIIDGVPAFCWEPGFYAGEVLAEFTNADGKLLASYRFDVTPNDHKLGRDEFAEMLDELFAFDPHLVIGTEASQTSIGISGQITNPHLEYARLRRYGPELLKSLSAITERPLTMLCTERAQRRPHQVKRLDQYSLRQAIRSPTALGVLSGTEVLDDVQRSALFDVPVTYESLDIAANQTIAATLHAVARRIREVSDALQSHASKEVESETRTLLMPRVPRRLAFLNTLSTSLRRMAKLSPFSSVSRTEISAAGLNALSAHPSYARAFRHSWYILRGGLSGKTTDESLWMRPTWEIYERWCFLKVAKIAQHLLPGFSWTCDYPTQKDDCIHMRGNGNGAKVSVWLQARCPAWDRPAFMDFRSVSGERIPDIMVTFESNERSAFLVLDAKYRTTRKGVLDGMQSAHLYSDCIRWHGGKPWRSLLLVPREAGASWLEAGSFHKEHGVGIVPMGADTGTQQLSHVLRELIAPKEEQP
jgi:hypothetical protein